MASPKLRFKEFDGDWSKYKIAETTEYLVDGTHFSPKSTEGEFKYITSKNIRNDGLDLSNLSYISKEEHDVIFKRCKVQLGDILLTKDGANTGNCCLNTLDEEFSLLSSVAVLRGKQGHFDNKFLLQILQSDIGQNTITSSMAGQAITRITLAKLKDYSFHFPLHKEQTKIASFLSNVDEKISQLTQKHELLSQYKQGMMQKLFSQQLRFKADDGSEFGEWESISIKSAVSFIKDGTHGTHQDDPTSHLFLLSAKNLQNGHVVIDEKDRRINKLEFDSIYKNYGLNTGDILLSVVGTIGRVAIFKEEYKNYAFQRSVAFMRFKSAKPEFIFQLFNAVDFQNELLVRQVVSAQPGIYLGDLSKIEIKLPCQEEQTKIANFLSAIDQKIEVVAQQIEQAKQWKKGLLQQMFV